MCTNSDNRPKERFKNVKNMPKHLIIFLLIICTVISACKRRDLDEDDSKVKTKEPARDILAEHSSLHPFMLDELIYDKNMDIRDEKMEARFINFRPSATDEEPDDDDDPTPNWLKYSEDFWDESHRAWGEISSPLQQGAYSKTRPYQLIVDGQLQAPVSSKHNRPIYENIEENIFERHLGVSFVWDFGSYGKVKTDRDISHDYIDQLETLYGFPLLEQVKTWSNIDYQSPRFSEGAQVLAATRSVAYHSYVIESLSFNNTFSLKPTELPHSDSNLENTLANYTSNSSLLQYRFIIDYINEYEIYLQFDLNSDEALLYDADKQLIERTNLLWNNDRTLLEINTQALSHNVLEKLHLEPYFNPIVAGPFNGKYVYGKYYPKTDKYNRELLKPMFFFNSTAKNDIKRVIKDWRQQEHDDRWD